MLKYRLNGQLKTTEPTIDHYIDLTGLPADLPCEISVAAINGAGEGAPSKPVTVIPQYGTKSLPPVIWLTEASNNGCTIGQGYIYTDQFYEVRYTATPGDSASWKIIPSRVFGAFRVSELENGQKYFLQMRTIPQGGGTPGEWSEMLAATPGATALSGKAIVKGILQQNGETILSYCVNSTFEYFPGIVISHSKDLENWKQIGHVFSKSEDLDLNYFFDGMEIWAPHISYCNGEFYIYWYYFVMAASSGLFNGYHILIARSKSVYGPFDNSPNNPYLTRRNPNAINFHQGHGKIFNTQNGEWFTMVLSQRWIQGEIKGQKRGISQLGRETSLERITWDENGWPVANGGKGPLDANIRPNLPWTPVCNPSGDEFSSRQLGIQWVFRRNPVYENFSLTRKKTGVLWVQ